jgi:flagellar basal body-associated protein FliL
LLIIGGTVLKGFVNKIHVDAKHKDSLWNDNEGQTFTGLGMLRVSTADPQPGMVVLSVSFIYYPEDKAFSEELVLRVRDFREIIANYIGSFSKNELHQQDEDNLKLELLHRFNAILRLGQINQIYFSDFMIIG